MEHTVESPTAGEPEPSVSCKVALPLFSLAQQQHLSSDMLCTRAGLDPEHVSVRYHWFPWPDAIALLDATSELLGGPEALESAITRLVAQPAPLVERVAPTSAAWADPRNFDTVSWKIAESGALGAIRVELPPTVPVHPAFLALLTGTLRGLPSRVGLPAAQVHSRVQGAVIQLRTCVSTPRLLSRLLGVESAHLTPTPIPPEHCAQTVAAQQLAWLRGDE